MMMNHVYVIAGGRLQGKIMDAIESLKCDYDAMRFSERGSENYFHCYANYVADIEVLRELLSLQGLHRTENQMVLEYLKDLCY